VKPARLALLAVFLAALAAAGVYRDWVGAQGRALVVVATVGETPVLAWAVGVATREPRVDESVVAGQPSTVARPGGSGPWPAFVFVNGVTARGRRHPDVQRLARGLARAGYLVVIPDLPGLAQGEITPRTAAATVAVGLATAALPDAEDRRVGFLGVSMGASLALLAAEDRALAHRVSVVGAIAPYTDLVDVVRLATTGVHLVDGKPMPFDADSFVSLVVARSLAAGLQPARDRLALLETLPTVEDDPPRPLAVLDHRRVARTAGGRGLVRLYRSLPASVRSSIARLSPIAGARRLRAPVEIASAPKDKYFPVAESRELQREAGGVRFTVTSTLDHAIPEPSPGQVLDLFRFDAFVVRVLREAR
jgi:pimeloyl-ACP methyl ester carboxylesterase